MSQDNSAVRPLRRGGTHLGRAR